LQKLQNPTKLFAENLMAKIWFLDFLFVSLQY